MIDQTVVTLKSTGSVDCILVGDFVPNKFDDWTWSMELGPSFSQWFSSNVFCVIYISNDEFGELCRWPTMFSVSSSFNPFLFLLALDEFECEEKTWSGSKTPWMPTDWFLRLCCLACAKWSLRASLGQYLPTYSWKSNMKINRLHQLCLVIESIPEIYI